MCSSDLASVLNDPGFQAKFLTPQGFSSAAASLPDFTEFLKADRETGARLVRIANVKLD